MFTGKKEWIPQNLIIYIVFIIGWTRGCHCYPVFQLTIIVLIVPPSAVVISHYILTEVVINYFKNISTIDNIKQNLEYAKLSINLFSAFQIIVFVVMVLIYPPYPAPFSIEKYFIKRFRICSIRIRAS